jgi:hypothetical protein
MTDVNLIFFIVVPLNNYKVFFLIFLEFEVKSNFAFFAIGAGAADDGIGAVDGESVGGCKAFFNIIK